MTTVDKLTMKNSRTFALIEIGIVVLSGFVASYAMKTAGFDFFALPHLVFLFTAVIFRSIVSNWRLYDYGLRFNNIVDQIKLGLLVWILTQAYQSLLQAFSLLFGLEKLGAITFNIKTIYSLWDKVIKIAFLKAGILESLRYFSYIQGLLMEALNPALGSFMTFIYFGTSHISIMNLIVLPVSFLFVYFYRTYKLIIPVIIFHILGDTISFIQIYFSYNGLYVYNIWLIA